MKKIVYTLITKENVEREFDIQFERNVEKGIAKLSLHEQIKIMGSFEVRKELENLKKEYLKKRIFQRFSHDTIRVYSDDRKIYEFKLWYN